MKILPFYFTDNTACSDDLPGTEIYEYAIAGVGCDTMRNGGWYSILAALLLLLWLRGMPGNEYKLLG